MMKAVISGDIIASTSLSDAGREIIEATIKTLIEELGNRFNTYARILRGDYIECAVPEPQDALQVALAIKSYIKAIRIEDAFLYQNSNRADKFKTYGIRLAIGYGELSRFDPIAGIIDGEAMYLSGRTINEFSSYDKKRVVIKQTLFFMSKNSVLNFHLKSTIELLDFLINKATARQCQVLYLKLMNNNEERISAILNISQSVVNKHSTNLGWNAVETAVEYYRELIKSY